MIQKSKLDTIWSTKTSELHQALGKARGDGLGMEFSRADFTVMETPKGWRGDSGN